MEAGLVSIAEKKRDKDEVFMELKLIKPNPKTIKSLSPYDVMDVTAVHLVDENGKLVKTMGYLKDPELADLFAKRHPLSKRIKLCPVVVMIDNTGSGFIITDPIHVTGNAEAEKMIQQMISAGLSPREKEIMQKKIP